MPAPAIPRKQNPDFPNRESLSARRDRGAQMMKELHRMFPDSRTALDWKTPFQLLVATILSAQCTDVRVNLVTPALFNRFPGPADFACAAQSEVEELVHSTGFYRNKSKNIIAASKRIMERYAGEVPSTMEELLSLAGVARKTANCVMGTAFRNPVGVVVDTHVGRIARRMGYTREQDPVKVERDLMKVFERQEWTYLSHSWIDHGRATCTSRTARCEQCELAEICPRRV
ncbi:MAG: endonuclease III [Planctomycetes bacterium]|nr:endonuclease III [Planctomycetota bacterium]